MILNKLKKEKKEEIISNEDYVSRKEFNKLKRRLDAHQYYLDNIYIFYTLEPTTFLTVIRDLSYELMVFLNNLCQKCDLTYWLDYDTLLNAIRHEEFIPENFELNIGMIKSDLMKFIDVFQSEMDNSVLEDISYELNKSKEYFQINFKFGGLEDFSFVINVFTYDYLEDKEFMVSDVENMKSFKAEILFPLDEVQLKNYYYPIPYNAYEYLKHSNENYMFSLSSIPDFNRLNRLRQQPNLINMLETYKEMIRSVNENF